MTRDATKITFASGSLQYNHFLVFVVFWPINHEEFFVTTDLLKFDCVKIAGCTFIRVRHEFFPKKPYVSNQRK